MRVITHTTPDAFTALAAEWNPLLERSAANTVFLTNEWQATWWRELGDGDLRVLELRDDDGGLAGIAPLFVQRNALGVAQAMLVACKEVADYVDFIFARGREVECLAASLDAIAAPGFWGGGEDGGVTLCNIPEASTTLAFLPELAAARGWRLETALEDVCPLIVLPDTFDGWLAMLDGKERRETQRKLRRASEDTQVVYAADSARLEADVDTFIQLMKASTYAKSGFMTARMERYFHAICRAMFDAGRLQLAFLEVEGQRAAAYLNFVYDNKVLVYNSGLDPARFSYLSPGVVLMARLIERAIAEKRSVLDFLQGNEEYKYRLGGKDTRVFIATLSR
jgi:CelD/BcsL family acetyltransferase involved in cellulose biosynthesis